METHLLDYAVNSTWQLPLIAAGTWLALRIVRVGPTAQYRCWVAALLLMIATPLLTQRSHTPALAPSTAAPSFSQPSQTPPSDATSPAISSFEFTPPADAAPTPSPVTSSQPNPPAFRIPFREMALGTPATLAFIGLYLAALAFMAIRLLSSCILASRVLAQATPVNLDPHASSLLDQCCRRLNVARPAIFISQKVSSPMLIGFVRPSLLLPKSFADASALPDHELEAIWLHELTHLRRGDYLANLACRIAALPIAYHPATSAVQRRIRQTREMICDSHAAATMQSPTLYARCLLNLARTMQVSTPQIEAVGMFNNGILEERIMQLTRKNSLVSPGTRTLRLACGASMMLAVLAVPAMFHVTLTLAQTSVPAAANSSVATEPAAAAPLEQAPPQATVPVATPKPKATPKARREIASPAAADAKPAAITAESNSQLESARKRLDDAAKVYGKLAAKAARDHDQSSEKPELKQQLEDARKQLSEANRAWNDQIAGSVDSTIRRKQLSIDSLNLDKRVAEAQAKLNSQEFKEQMAKVNQQMANAQARFNSPEWKAQMDKLNSPEFKKRMEEAQARFNSPEFKKQMADVQARFNSPEFKKQMADVQARFNSAEFQKRMADMQARFNSPEFKQKTERMAAQMAEMQARFNSPEWKAQIDKLNSPEFKKRMDEIQQKIDDALKQWDAKAATAK